MSETREAAKRLRRIRAGKSVVDVYDSPTREDSYEGLLVGDCETLADAFLATYNEDDDEPITAERLKSIGGWYQSPSQGCWCHEKFRALSVRFNPIAEVCSFDCPYPGVKTMGDLRQLLRLLEGGEG